MLSRLRENARRQQLKLEYTIPAWCASTNVYKEIGQWQTSVIAANKQTQQQIYLQLNSINCLVVLSAS